MVCLYGKLRPQQTVYKITCFVFYALSEAKKGGSFLFMHPPGNENNNNNNNNNSNSNSNSSNNNNKEMKIKRKRTTAARPIAPTTAAATTIAAASAAKRQQKQQQQQQQQQQNGNNNNSDTWEVSLPLTLGQKSPLTQKKTFEKKRTKEIIKKVKIRNERVRDTIV